MDRKPLHRHSGCREFQMLMEIYQFTLNLHWSGDEEIEKKNGDEYLELLDGR